MKAVDRQSPRRPKRSDEPMDAQMSASDIAWLRSREPFASLDENAFAPNGSVDKLLRDETKLHRCEPGQMIARQGDYGSSAFLVLAGEVSVLRQPLSPQQLGRIGGQPQEATGGARWHDSFRWISQRWLTSSRRGPDGSEMRRIDQVVPADPDHMHPSIQSVDGEPALFLQDFANVLETHESVTLGPSELFGEISALYRTPRSSTVIAKTESTLLEIRWQGLRMMLSDQPFSQRIDEHYREAWLAIHLRELPLFQSVPAENLARVVAQTQVRSFGRQAWNVQNETQQNLPAQAKLANEPVVARAGNVPTDLIIVRGGFARQTRPSPSATQNSPEETVSYLGRGKVFGMDEVIHNASKAPSDPPQAYQSSLRAIDLLDTLQIPVETFATEILPFIDRSKRLPVTDAADIPSGLVEFIIDNRYQQARSAMVIDLHRCTKCDDCVKACESIHDGNSRFTLDGPTYERFQITNACAQCDDPVCMIGCPTGAITRNQTNGVIEIHESICIGCGHCASSCPFGSIRQTPIHAPDGKVYVDAATDQPLQKATKCDLCTHRSEGPACQNACRHDALSRISLVETPPLEHWLRGRSAA